MTAVLDMLSSAPARKGGKVGGRGRLTGWRVLVGRVLFAVVALGIWQVVGSSSRQQEFFISKPSSIGSAFYHMVQTGVFYTNVRATLDETVLGFAIGAAAGILFGFVCAFVPALIAILDPYLNALNALPRIALASLFILWFGLGTEPKVVLIISLVFFPLFFNAYQGATTVDPDHILLMRTFRSNRIQFVKRVILPSSVPWLVSGAKLGLAQALGGAVIGEIIAAQVGLGAQLNEAATSFDTSREFATLAALSIIAMGLNALMALAEKRASDWRAV